MCYLPADGTLRRALLKSDTGSLGTGTTLSKGGQPSPVKMLLQQVGPVTGADQVRADLGVVKGKVINDATAIV
jgi:hypothetical protein